MGWQTQVAVQIQAGDTIINSSGSFTYSSAPATGNLIATIAPAPGTDQFGNKYLDGITSYGAGIATQLIDGSIALLSGSLAAGWTALSTIFISGSGIIELIPAAGQGVITSNQTLDDGAGNMSVSGTMTVNGAAITIGNGGTADVILNPQMAIPPNHPTAGKTLAQTQAFIDGMFSEMEGRGFFV
jgi:hypothetical protein